MAIFVIFSLVVFRELYHDRAHWLFPARWEVSNGVQDDTLQIRERRDARLVQGREALDSSASALVQDVRK